MNASREWWADGPEDDLAEREMDLATEAVTDDVETEVYDELTDLLGENMAILLRDAEAFGGPHAYTTMQILDTVAEARKSVAEHIAQRIAAAAADRVADQAETRALANVED